MTLRFCSRCRRARRSTPVTLLVLCALAPSAAAMSTPPEASDLSPALAELAKPAVRSLPPAAQAKRLGVAVRGPGSVLRDGSRLLVDARFDAGALARLDDLRAAGAEVLAPSRRYQTVTVAVAAGGLRELAAVPGVVGVSENRAPLLFADGPSAAAAPGAECEGGAVISEGVAQLRAADARSKHGVDGAGVTVGVLSDSYDQATAASDGSGAVATHAAEDVASGDLPGPANGCSGQAVPVDVLQDFPGSAASDEGRAMLQIVHDVAPGADLAFATAFLSELSFAQNIERLARPVEEDGAGAEVIVDDVFWFEEPFFQDGPVAAAVNDVVAKGAAYFSAAGNNNIFEGENEIASWEAPGFRDAASCPAGVLAFTELLTGHCMDFDPGLVSDTTFAIVVSPGATLSLDLQWAEPWFGVEADLDAYLLNSTGSVIAAAESDNVDPGRQRPVEIVQWKNTSGTSKTVRLAINRCAAACNPAASASATPAVKFALLQNGGGVTQTEYPQSAGGDVVGPTIFGHAAAASAVAVAAVPFSDAAQVEGYSSRGPVTHRFEPVDGKDPAAPLPAPETIAKPDLAATDCGVTTFFAFRDGAGDWRFCGTSAAAPHAAAVAALQLQAEPAATVEEIRAAQTSTARPVGAFGPTAAGAGLLDADAAIASLLPPAVVTITEHPPSRSGDSTPTFGFQSIPAAAEFACAVDGGTAEPCASPYTVPTALPDGSHLFTVEAVEFGESASFSFTVDTTPPAIAFGERPAAITADAKPVFAFSASEPVDFACALDAAAAQPCGSPYAVGAPLAEGPHSFAVTAIDQAGNSAVAAVDFTVDTPAPGSAPAGLPPVRPDDPADRRPPQTFVRAHPPKILRTAGAAARAAFRFGSDEAGAAFVCKVDRGPWRSCGARLARFFGLGRHLLRVRARDRAGNLDRTPAVFGFRVERIASG
jgi:Subtilase family